MTANTRIVIVGLLGAAMVGSIGVILAADNAAAADPRRGPFFDNRARIEQDIRRNYNNYNRNIPTSPLTPRIRERHLRDGVLLGPTGTSTSAATCSYQYGRWKRGGSKYWRDRYFDCAG